MTKRFGERVRKAYLLAAEIHKDQRRQSGEAYIVHPVAVAYSLFCIGGDSELICAALLHDTLEDGDNVADLEERIYKEFGDRTLYLVRALSKDHSIDEESMQQAYIEQLKKALDIDIDVFFVKAADLLHNIRTVIALAPERKERWLRQLREQYLPLFAEYYHQIPLPHRDIYQNLMEEMLSILEKPDNHAIANST